MLANAFTSNDFSSLGPVVGGGCTSPQDSLFYKHSWHKGWPSCMHMKAPLVVPTKTLLALVREGDTHFYGQNTTHGMLYRLIQSVADSTKHLRPIYLQPF